MRPLIGGMNDWTKQSVNSIRSFKVLMKLKTVVKQNSDKMKKKESKCSSGTKNVVMLRQDSAAIQYLLNWKREHVVYLLYRSLLLDQGITLPSLNQFMQLLLRQLLAIPLKFWR
jgi:ABC-type enterochelin transport system permease subunit